MKTVILILATLLLTFNPKVNTKSNSHLTSSYLIPHSSWQFISPYAGYAIQLDHFFAGNTIVKSVNNNYTLVFQTDGNLVLYNSSHTALWASGPLVANPINLNIYDDGNIAELDNTGNSYWNSGGIGGSAPYPANFWVLQDDGNFVRYYGSPGAIAPGPTVSTGTAGGVRSNHFGTIR